MRAGLRLRARAIVRLSFSKNTAQGETCRVTRCWTAPRCFPFRQHVLEVSHCRGYPGHEVNPASPKFGREFARARSHRRYMQWDRMASFNEVSHRMHEANLPECALELILDKVSSK